MAIDHAGKAFYPLTAFPWHVAGRAALILFALVIAARLIENRGRAGRYLPRLILWGLIAQGWFMMLGNTQLNILFTLAAGIGMIAILSREGQVWPRIAVVVLIVLASPFVEYGAIGVLLVPVLVTIGQRLPYRQWTLPVSAALLCFVTQLPGPAWFLWPIAIACLASALLAYAVRLADIAMPRLPTVTFYALYAGHLAVIAIFARLV